MTSTFVHIHISGTTGNKTLEKKKKKFGNKKFENCNQKTRGNFSAARWWNPMASWSLFWLPSWLLVPELNRYLRVWSLIIDFVVVLVHHLLLWIRKNGIPAFKYFTSEMELNGTRFTNKPHVNPCRVPKNSVVIQVLLCV